MPVTKSPQITEQSPLNEDPCRVGATIRALREARGLGRAALSTACGISPLGLAHIEDGRALPESDLIDALAAQLTVPALALVTAGYAVPSLVRQWESRRGRVSSPRVSAPVQRAV